MSPPPAPLEVRQGTEGRWQVNIAPDHWLSCTSENDARLIALAVVYEHDFIYEVRNDLDFASELDQLADLFKTYRMGVGEGWLRVSATQIRDKHPNTNR